MARCDNFDFGVDLVKSVAVGAWFCCSRGSRRSFSSSWRKDSGRI
jgi:hypothetical protein